MIQTFIPLPAQPRNRKPESRRLHDDSLALRKKGIRVFRQGRFHCVNGKRLYWWQVRKMAEGVA